MPAAVARLCAADFAYAVSLEHPSTPESVVTAWLFAACDDSASSSYLWACWAEESVNVPGERCPRTRIRQWCTNDDWFTDIEDCDRSAYLAACELASTGYVHDTAWEWDGGAF
jgi:hypothetical protein